MRLFIDSTSLVKYSDKENFFLEIDVNEGTIVANADFIVFSFVMIEITDRVVRDFFELVFYSLLDIKWEFSEEFCCLSRKFGGKH